MMIFKLLFLMLVSCAMAQADNLYQYTDQSGNLVISNKNPNGGTKTALTTNETARRTILKEELEHEITALKQSQKLQEQNTTKDKMDLYSKDIKGHEKNINVLTKQLNQEL
ncbi:MAG TPA: hypothetical protein VKR58_02100 [Aquella sp.]|nr:hypothetical protein [Aquella sp.]